MRTEDLVVGMRVTYVPNHAENNASHPDCERGVVTGWSPQAEQINGGFLQPVTVFVRYGNDQNSKATSLEDLVAV